ncbi:MAG TPA: glycerol-3-phosphate dehydrogenase [Alphaproteobacteria bacterium]
MRSDVDLLIIGGGINGVGIARDAAGRGLKVLLCERADLAGATSSASSKLIHGGLRYLEYYEFRLVREALAEREVLLKIAPHIIWPMRFVLPHRAGLRPRWMVRLGLFLYDHIGGPRTLPGTEGIDFRRHPYGAPLDPSIAAGFAYSDCWVDDARLVVLNARDAERHGADIRVRTEVVAARREGDRWICTLRAGGQTTQVRARALVNAAGPWVMEALRDIARTPAKGAVRLVKGSHIVVPRLYDGDQAYILQNDDRRVIFVIPYERHFSLIGTTDVAYEGDPAAVRIDFDEIVYLCAAVSRQFRRPVSPGDIVWSYAGVRPLYDDKSANPSAVTRDYVFDVDAPAGAAPILSIFGGKITTYRRLAEHALEQLSPLLGIAKPSWTAGAPLPGGDFDGRSLAEIRADFVARYPWLDPIRLDRFVRSYGTELAEMLGDARSPADLGADLGGGLSEREVDWLITREWARTAEDILWRRTKLGLHVPAGTAERITGYLGRRVAA